MVMSIAIGIGIRLCTMSDCSPYRASTTRYVISASLFGCAELGPLTGDGAGLLIAAIVGGAVIPVIQGAIADHIGIHHAFVFPVLCYLVTAYYGLSGLNLFVCSKETTCIFVISH